MRHRDTRRGKKAHEGRGGDWAEAAPSPGQLRTGRSLPQRLQKEPALSNVCFRVLASRLERDFISAAPVHPVLALCHSSPRRSPPRTGRHVIGKLCQSGQAELSRANSHVLLWVSRMLCSSWEPGDFGRQNGHNPQYQPAPAVGNEEGHLTAECQLWPDVVCAPLHDHIGHNQLRGSTQPQGDGKGSPPLSREETGPRN